ncbi:hypothetical protein H6P81_015987 [Aristolochia fimbriata]|uniref:TF-B3 domain-containing protein n=1 Tax=Aristolochia fimbriata TaxID=158543 RepID=A0AAV7EA77_ARIFI|nr:hypothetical protein H6P81_015987 [Aristolochia fimbriata]
MGENSGDGNPQFYIILLEDFSTQVPLPRAFVNRYISKKRKPGKAILQAQSGEIWRVELTGGGGGRGASRKLYLRDGWESFARDNSLKEFDFLLFEYEGRMRFRVLIFDKNACERSTTPTTHARLPSSKKWLHKSPLNSRCSKKPKRDKPNSPNGRKIQAQEVLDLPPSSVSDMDSVSSSMEEKTDAWESSNAFTSKFPFFRKRITRSYADTSKANLVVPKDFSRAHLPREDSVFVFHLAEGNSRGEITYRSCPLHQFFSRGWRVFACRNNLGEGDVCVFELVGRLQMRIHVFRSAAALDGAEEGTTTVF